MPRTAEICMHRMLRVFVRCRIVQYALQRHLPGGGTVSSQAGCLDSVLQSRHAEANAQIQSSRCAPVNSVASKPLHLSLDCIHATLPCLRPCMQSSGQATGRFCIACCMYIVVATQCQATGNVCISSCLTCVATARTHTESTNTVPKLHITLVQGCGIDIVMQFHHCSAGTDEPHVVAFMSKPPSEQAGTHLEQHFMCISCVSSAEVCCYVQAVGCSCRPAEQADPGSDEPHSEDHKHPAIVSHFAPHSALLPPASPPGRWWGCCRGGMHPQVSGAS